MYSNVVSRQPKTELGNYNEQALAAMHKAMFNKLKSIGQIKLQRGNAQAISDERLDFINYAINRRIKEIVDLVKETYHLSD